MKRKILFVDDEPALLDTYCRMFGRTFEVDAAEGPVHGLEKLERFGPYAVIVSDQRMPGMSGTDFLARARQIAPESVRVMLTGYCDLDSAIRAVNEGNIFLFLQKPCMREDLEKALRTCIAQYELIISERELLEETLAGSIKVLAEVLALVNPGAFGKASRIRRYVEHMAKQTHSKDSWQYEVAGLLSQIGCVSLPPELLDKASAGQPLTPDEERIFTRHPEIAKELLAKIPRLETVARIIGMQLTPRQGETAREDGAGNLTIMLGATMLRVALALDRSITGGDSLEQAMSKLKQHPGTYPPELVKALADLEVERARMVVRAVTVRQLDAGMILDEDVWASSGLLLAAKGLEVTEPVLLRLRSFAAGVGVIEPFRVRVPEHLSLRAAA